MAAISRSANRKLIAGVMGGIAEHFQWNTSILRVIFVIFSISSAAFPGIIVYLILWMIMPSAAANSHHSNLQANQADD